MLHHATLFAHHYRSQSSSRKICVATQLSVNCINMDALNVTKEQGESVSRTPQAAKLGLAVVLGVYLVTSVAYNLSIPVGEAPDEPGHIRYVEVLRSTGKLPTIPRNSPRYSYEADQPPLYYLSQAAWVSLLWPTDALMPQLRANPDFSFASDAVPNTYLHDYPPAQAVPVHLMRLLSTLFGLCTLVFIWLAARTAWPEDAGAALLAVGFAAFIPGFTFTSGTVTNDSLAATTGAAFVFSAVHMLRRGVSMRSAALAGLAVGVGLLSKRSLLVMLPILILVLLLSPASTRRAKWVGVGVALLVTLAIGMWPFIVNIVEYGDPLAAAATFEAKSEIADPLARVPGFWLSPAYLSSVFNSFWGSFGLRHIDLPLAVYLVYYALCVVAIIGIAMRFRAMALIERWTTFTLLVVLLLTNAGLAYENTQFWAPQGRLLLPSLAALTLLVGRGLSITGARLLPTHTRARHIALAAFLAALTLLNWYALVRYILVPYYT